MTVLDLRKHYSRFLQGHEGKIHLAAHSHHFWPDVSRDGHIEYWDDCAKSSDHKWDKIFTEIIPFAQNKIAELLQLKNPQQIVFAPNTHELTSRLLSLFLGRNSLKILTTDSEFHSWKRQVRRLEEFGQVQVTWVKTDNLLSDREAFFAELETELKKHPDIFFISQVFFDSGLAISMEEFEDMISELSPDTMVVIDGYHGFAAIPTNLSRLEGKVFYLAGGYKYAQSGEGAAFMVIPQNHYRPSYTGWFAQFAALSQSGQELVGYSKDFMSFMGSTQDMSGLYRFKSVWTLFQNLELSISDIHQHVESLQALFLQEFNEFFINQGLKLLVSQENAPHGHFLTYQASDELQAQDIENNLKKCGILIDRRGDRLRFGFGLYHVQETLMEMKKRIKNF